MKRIIFPALLIASTLLVGCEQSQPKSDVNSKLTKQEQAIAKVCAQKSLRVAYELRSDADFADEMATAFLEECLKENGISTHERYTAAQERDIARKCDAFAIKNSNVNDPGLAGQLYVKFAEQCMKEFDLM